MNQGRNAALIIGAVLVVALGAVLYQSSQPAKVGDAPAADTAGRPDVAPSTTSSLPAAPAAGSALPGGSPAGSGPANIGAPANHDPQLARDLDRYSTLRAKAVLSKEDMAEKEKLLRRPELLRETEALLKEGSTTALGSEAHLAQNNAVDLLLDARANGDTVEAERALRSIIEDKRIEDPQIDEVTRKTLAGLKAEILFQWSAQEPAKSDEMRSWLPGPVSQRIWQNVLKAQNQNAQESATDVH